MSEREGTMGDDDRTIHPIELIRNMAQLVNVLDRLVIGIEREAEHRTEFEAHLRGLYVNDLLWAGAAVLNAAGAYCWQKSFQVPFAAVTIEDANSVGDLLVVGGSQSAELDIGGVGRWRVPKGQRRVVPITNSSLSVTSLTPTAGIFYVAVWTSINQANN